MDWYKKSQNSDDDGFIIAYHGSERDDLAKLNAHMPSYVGGLGSGVYLGIDRITAEYYGHYVYKCRLNFGWDKVFTIDSESVEFLEGDSISSGESIPPFAFVLAGKKHYVTDMDSSYEDSYFKKTMILNYFKNMVLKNNPPWAKIVLSEISGRDDLPGLEDLELNDFEPEEFEEFKRKYDVEIETYLQEAIKYGESINELGLEEIGREVQDAGYSAVYAEGIRFNSSVNEEILVFDENNVEILERIK